MATKRESILSAAVTALAGTSGVGTRIYRSRVVALARSEHPALVVEPVQDTADRPNLQKIDWTLLFQVTAYVRSDTPDNAADAIIQDVHSKIMNNATLNGYIMDIVPSSVAWGLHEADQPLGVIQMQFTAQYQTNALDITS